jgi:hypothetical protein
MTVWDSSPKLMGEVHASIQPVETKDFLRDVLAQDFPRECSNLPISGGWGYTQADAVLFLRDLFSQQQQPDFVPLEYLFVQKIVYEELIIFRPKDYRFSGIELKLDTQNLIQTEKRKYDLLKCKIMCWADWHWDQLKSEWEQNDFGRNPAFDMKAHEAKRVSSKVNYERSFWFDITDVFDRG